MVSPHGLRHDMKEQYGFDPDLRDPAIYEEKND